MDIEAVKKTKLESINARQEMFSELDLLYNQVTISDELIKNTPNDADLGSIIRETYINKIEQYAKSTQDQHHS